MNIGNRRTPPPPPRPSGRPGSRPPRVAPRKSFLERNRGRLLWALAGVALLATAGIAFFNAASPAYACAAEWSPQPTPSPAPSATQRLGYVQTDTGREHVTTGAFVKYALCPPATGKHYNASGQGPIRAGLFGPDDAITPQGWIHNLEHGGLVLLYRCDNGDNACSDAGQAALRQFNASFPNSPVCNLPPGSIGPVIARFDQMKTPYAALLWGLVLPLDTLDTNEIYTFFTQSAERTNPESLCARPSPTPGPTGTPGPTSTPGPSASSSATPTVSPTAASTASPTPGAS